MKTTLKTLYQTDFSSSAFKHDEADYSEWQIQGKFCLISLSGNTLDIWLIKPNLNPLTMRKLNSMISHMEPLSWTILEGEAYTRTTDLDFIRRNSSVLGIKSKRAYSEATLEQLRTRLSKKS